MITLYSDTYPRGELDANSIEYNLREDIGCLKEDIQELVEALRPFSECNNKPKMYAIDLRVFDLSTPIKIADALVKKYDVT